MQFLSVVHFGRFCRPNALGKQLLALQQHRFDSPGSLPCRNECCTTGHIFPFCFGRFWFCSFFFNFYDTYPRNTKLEPSRGLTHHGACVRVALPLSGVPWSRNVVLCLAVCPSVLQVNVVCFLFVV
ncbi:unnamed protein product [Ectocarpus sp. 4 AP-2014]